MGVGLLYSLIPLLIFPRQEGCGRNGVFARKSTMKRQSAYLYTYPMSLLIKFKLSGSAGSCSSINEAKK